MGYFIITNQQCLQSYIYVSINKTVIQTFNILLIGDNGTVGLLNLYPLL